MKRLLLLLALSLTARATESVVFIDLGSCLKKTNYKEIGTTKKVDLVVQTPQGYIKVIKSNWGVVTLNAWNNIKSKYKCKKSK